MLWTIVRRELLSHLISLRFAVCLVLCTALSAASCYLLAEDYGNRLARYNADQARSKEAVQEVKVYALLRPEVHRPPTPLSVFAEGLDRKMGTRAVIAIEEVPYRLTGGQVVNEFAPVFPILDFATIVGVVLSLLALLLSYDSISGEKERGTLRICLANACPRHQILLGKYLGSFLALGVSLLVTLIVCLLIVSAHPAIALGTNLLARTALIFLAALLALSCFLLLGLWVSARTQQSFTTLVVLLFVWVLTVFVLPRTGGYAARQAYKVTDRKTVEHQVSQLLQEAGDKVQAYRETLGPRGFWAAMSGTGEIVNWKLLPAGNPYPVLEYYRKFYAYAAPLYVGYSGRAWDLRRRREQELARQQRLAEGFQLLSPAALFVDVARRIAGTDVYHFRRFMDGLRRYRRSLIEHLEEKQVFSSYAFTSLYEPNAGEKSFFTHFQALQSRIMQMAHGIQPGSEEAKQLFENEEFSQLAAQYEEENRTLKDRWKAFIQDHPQKSTQIDLAGMPVFKAPVLALGTVATAASPILLVLCVYNVLLFLLAHAAFLRCDVR